MTDQIGLCWAVRVELERATDFGIKWGTRPNYKEPIHQTKSTPVNDSPTDIFILFFVIIIFDSMHRMQILKNCAINYIVFEVVDNKKKLTNEGGLNERKKFRLSCEG